MTFANYADRDQTPQDEWVFSPYKQNKNEKKKKKKQTPLETCKRIIGKQCR